MDPVLQELQDFIDSQPSSAPGPMHLDDASFAHYVRDESPGDVDQLALAKKAEREAAELEELKESIRLDMKLKGWDFETKSWRRPEPVEPDPSTPFPAFATDEAGTPTSTPDAFAAWVEGASQIGSLTDVQFDALLAARAKGSTVVMRPEGPDPDEVNAIFDRYGGRGVR
jgi:hypothetical protein